MEHHYTEYILPPPINHRYMELNYTEMFYI